MFQTTNQKWILTIPQFVFYNPRSHPFWPFQHGKKMFAVVTLKKKTGEPADVSGCFMVVLDDHHKWSSWWEHDDGKMMGMMCRCVVRFFSLSSCRWSSRCVCVCVAPHVAIACNIRILKINAQLLIIAVQTEYYPFCWGTFWGLLSIFLAIVRGRIRIFLGFI